MRHIPLLLLGIAISLGCSDGASSTPLADGGVGGDSQIDSVNDGGGGDGGGGDAGTGGAIGPTGLSVRMDDLAILLPLGPGLSSYVTLASAGAKGPLIPKATYVAASLDQPLRAQSGDPYEAPVLIAIRLDPCAKKVAPWPTDGTGCAPQLRLVFQTLTNGGTSTTDSGIHALYALSRDEFVQTMRSVLLLRKGLPEEPRGAVLVHPIIEKQGLGGGYAKGLRDVILAHAGKDNLVKIARMSGTFGLNWAFAAHDVAKDGTVTKARIAHAGNPNDVVVEQIMGAGIDPPPFDDVDSVRAVMSPEARTTTTAQAQLAAMDAAVRVQNPTKHVPETMDCVTCHGAHVWQGWAFVANPKTAPNTRPDWFVQDKKYVSDAEMVPNGGQGLSVHMFGYLAASPVILPRVANDTAVAVAYANANLAP